MNSPGPSEPIMFLRELDKVVNGLNLCLQETTGLRTTGFPGVIAEFGGNKPLHMGGDSSIDDSLLGASSRCTYSRDNGILAFESFSKGISRCGINFLNGDYSGERRWLLSTDGHHNEAWLEQSQDDWGAHSSGALNQWLEFLGLYVWCKN